MDTISKVFWRSLGFSPPRRNPTLPTGLKKEAKLNDSVWELYCPADPCDVVIIFFHGLQIGDFEEAFWKTWVSTNVGTDKIPSVVWPQTWLPKKFPRARILSISYDSTAQQTGNDSTGDMYVLGENLVHDIILNDNNIGQSCPVFLVGHSLGGIVIKQFILRASQMRNVANPSNQQSKIDKIDIFLKNFRGVFYYATPHQGSELANVFDRVKSAGPFIRLLKTLDTIKQKINKDFSIHTRNYNVRTFAIGENRPMFHAGQSLVVPSASASYDVDDFYLSPGADHISVCKATDENDAIVIEKLVSFIRGDPPDTSISYCDPHDNVEII